MSTSEPTVPASLPWWERGADWLNAILVKEARQSLKSRQFVLTFLMLLLAAWAVSAFGLALSGAEVEYGNLGRGFFFSFYFVLAVATLLIVPFGAYRSLLAERDLNTYELLSITTLSPGKIVWGKLGSAMLQLFIFYSAITPFIAFASLLNGFDVPTAAYVLASSLLGSLLLSMASLMFATLAKQRLWQGFNSLLVLAGLVIALILTLIGVYGLTEAGGLTFDQPGFWLFTSLSVLAGVSYFVLLHQITVSQLTFESDNRSTGIRLSSNVQVLLFWICFIGVGIYSWGWHSTGIPYEGFVFGAIVSSIHWGVFGLFALTEPDMLSHRVARGLPRNRLLRLLLVPFLPGGARGMVWLLLNLVFFWFVVVAGIGLVGQERYTSGTLGSWSFETALGRVLEEFGKTFVSVPHSWSMPVQVWTALCCYLVIYLGIGCAAGRVLRRHLSEINAAHLRVMTFLLLTAGIVVPLLLLWFRDMRPASLIDVTSPFLTLDRIISPQSAQGYELYVLLIAALVVVVVNLRGMAHGVAAVMRHGAEQGGSDEVDPADIEVVHAEPAN